MTSLNAGLADIAGWRRIRAIRWPSADGREIEGLLVEPGGGGATRRPLVVNIHGGPTAGYRYAFLPYGAWMAIDPGYPVLLVNYRGTPGYGASFTRGNVGDPGGLELQDILTGIDACIAEEIADPDRIGVMGGSYGGYLAAWAVTQTERSPAGSSTSGSRTCSAVPGRATTPRSTNSCLANSRMATPAYAAMSIDRRSPTSPTSAAGPGAPR